MESEENAQFHLSIKHRCSKELKMQFKYSAECSKCHVCDAQICDSTESKKRRKITTKRMNKKLKQCKIECLVLHCNNPALLVAGC